MSSVHHSWLVGVAIAAGLLAWQSQARQSASGEPLPGGRIPEVTRQISNRSENLPAQPVREYSGASFSHPGATVFFLCVGDPSATYELVVESGERRDRVREFGDEPLSPRREITSASSDAEPQNRLTFRADSTTATVISELRPATRDVPNRKTAVNRAFFFPSGSDGELSRSPALLETQLIAESREARLYLESGVSLEQAFDGFLDAVAELADAVVAASRPVWGQCRDVDDDGKLSIVLTSRLAQFGNAGGRLDGCVRWEDFQELAPRSVSNAADVVFLNPAVPDRNQLFAVLAHEYGHLLAFTRRGIGLEPGAAPDEDWLNEAVAHVLEIQLSGQPSNLAGRVDAFVRHPERSPLVVTNSTQSGLWRDPGSRGAGYLFLEWLVRPSSVERLDRLMAGPERGTQLIEAVAGRNFPAVWTNWAAEVWASGIPAGAAGDVRRFPVAINLSASALPCRIPVRGMSVCYLQSTGGSLDGAVVKVYLPGGADWIEGRSQRRGSEGNPIKVADRPSSPK